LVTPKWWFVKTIDAVISLLRLPALVLAFPLWCLDKYRKAIWDAYSASDPYSYMTATVDEDGKIETSVTYGGKTFYYTHEISNNG
jgi:hypothetical protein